MAFACTLPATSTVQQDDAQLRITRWDFEPGAVTGWHSHGWPYYVVMLTDAVQEVHDGETVHRFIRKTGDAYARDPGVQHDVRNGGDAPMAFIEIEVKMLSPALVALEK